MSTLKGSESKTLAAENWADSSLTVLLWFLGSSSGWSSGGNLINTIALGRVCLLFQIQPNAKVLKRQQLFPFGLEFLVLVGADPGLGFLSTLFTPLHFPASVSFPNAVQCKGVYKATMHYVEVDKKSN